MAAEIEKLLAQGSEIETRIATEVAAMYLCGGFRFFPSPELVEACKKAADDFARFYPSPAKDTPDGEKFRVAAGIASRFVTVYSPIREFVRTGSGEKVLAKQTALVVSYQFDLPATQLVICNNQILKASPYPPTSLAGTRQVGDLLAHGGGIPGVLEGIKDLKELTAKAQELFPVGPKA